MGNIIEKHIYESEYYKIADVDVDIINHREQFSDRANAEFAGMVTRVLVYNGEIIDGVQFVYEDAWEGEIHGNSGSNKNEFALDKNEYLTGVFWSVVEYPYYGGMVLNSICFETNKGKKFEVHAGLEGKEEHKYSYQSKETHAILGLKGYASGYFNAITHVICRETAVNYADESYYYDDYFSLINAKKLTKITGYSALVIDKLQFVYDDDPGLTRMHGNGNGDYFEFKLDADEYINKLIWHTAITDLGGYGSSPVLTQLEIYTNKNRKLIKGYYEKQFSELDERYRIHFSHKHIYTCEMKDDEELFCLSGVFSKYMGRILTVYKRRRSVRKALSGKQRNSNDKDILFVCHINKRENNETKHDNAAKGLVDMMLSYHSLNYIKKLDIGFNREQKARFAFLPCVDKADSLKTSQVTISSEDFKKALLSGQYKYISIRSHGTQASCGNAGAGLADVKWVRENAKIIKEKLNNTIIAFNCCECAHRGETEQYRGYEGLAREFVKAGVRAVFGYTIEYLSIDNYLKITDEYRKKAYRNIYNLIDDVCVKNLDGQTTPEKMGELVKKKMGKQIEEYGQKIDDLEEICKEKKIPGIKQKEFARYLGRELRKNDAYKPYYTEDGSIIKSEGAEPLRAAVLKWFDKTRNEEMRRKQYSAYVDFWVNYQHLCGPGTKLADEELKRNNLGDFCQDFCNLPDSHSGEL